ncbi:acyltransferase family protein [bacterium]|nr:acyltransferase family protein [bacterium]
MESNYINISRASSSSLVERDGASTTLNSFVPIKEIAEAKGLKSTRSLRLPSSVFLHEYYFYVTINSMDAVFSSKINLLKMLAIALVVSGHLEFSIFGMFPPFSFQLSLFFFISGMLFKDKYLDNIGEFFKRRVKSLLIPYFLYSSFYTVITILIYKITGKFWGMELNLKNFFIVPFLNGHQLDICCPLWFVPQLFIVIILFLFCQKMLRKTNEPIRTIFYLALGLSAIPLVKVIDLTDLNLFLIRTMFSIFFVYLGHLYVSKIRHKFNLFTPKILGFVICLQSILWLFNRDFTTEQGIGLSYVLVWGRFDNQLIVPILTSITGIWFSMFFINVTFDYIKNIKFLKLVGENTYHIMANHVFVMFLITNIFLIINKIPVTEMNNHSIYWIYNPIQTTYLYFVLTMVITTYSGVLLKLIKSNFQQNRYLNEK